MPIKVSLERTYCKAHLIPNNQSIAVVNISLALSEVLYIYYTYIYEASSVRSIFLDLIMERYLWIDFCRQSCVCV